MSLHIHINDEAGLWTCSGPYRDSESAIKEVERITYKRADGPWKRKGKSWTWVKKSNPDHYIEIVEK